MAPACNVSTKPRIDVSGGEVRAHLLQSAQLGDILDDGERADHLLLPAHRRDVQPQGTVTATDGGSGRHLVGINALLAHGLGENLVQLDVAGDLVDVLVLRIAHDAQQLFRHRRNVNDVQVLVHGNDAVLHLRHHRTEHVVSVFLLEYAILYPGDDGIILRSIGVFLPKAFHPGVEVAVREAIQRRHDLLDHCFTLHHIEYDDDGQDDGQPVDDGQQHQRLVVEQDRHRVRHRPRVKQIFAVFIAIDDIKRHLALWIGMTLQDRLVRPGHGDVLFGQTAVSLIRGVHHRPVRREQRPRRAFSGFQGFKGVGTGLHGVSPAEIARQLTGDIQVMLDFIVGPVGQPGAVIGHQQRKGNQRNQGHNQCNP